VLLQLCGIALLEVYGSLVSRRRIRSLAEDLTGTGRR
jgi:hypothetical protein